MKLGSSVVLRSDSGFGVPAEDGFCSGRDPRSSGGGVSDVGSDGEFVGTECAPLHPILSLFASPKLQA